METLERIAEICKRENEYSQLSADERLRKRKVHLKPVVVAFFEQDEKVKAENLLPPSSPLDGIDTIDGVKVSTIAYSIAEAAKANNLNLYRYYEHLLTEIPKHMNDKDTSFLDSLLPQSD